MSGIKYDFQVATTVFGACRSHRIVCCHAGPGGVLNWPGKTNVKTPSVRDFLGLSTIWIRSMDLDEARKKRAPDTL